MIKFLKLAACLAALFGPVSATAQQSQPSAMLLAQATDRCMATTASRQLRTLEDEAIFQNALQACDRVKTAFYEAVRREHTPEDAENILSQLDEQRRPNFIKMLRRIEAQRDARSEELREQGFSTNDGTQPQ